MAKTTTVPDVGNLPPPGKSVNKFRNYLSQVLASAACTLMMVDLSVSVYFSTVVIGQLQKTTGPLSLDDEKASWIGSIPFICQPIGSLVSGVLTDLMGRQRVMILMNLPFLLGWILMCTAPSYAILCLASIVVGITLGLVEAPLTTYIGEVCQPAIRGIMSSSTSVMYQLGTVLVLLAGTLTDWRTTAGMSAAIPIATAISMFLVPEAPIWLISKGRIRDAEKALCWLRGWVQPADVEQELKELITYHDSAFNKDGVVMTAKPANYVNYGTQESLNNTSLINISDRAEQSSFVNPAYIDDNAVVHQGDNEVEIQKPAPGSRILDRIRQLGLPSSRRPLCIVIPFMFFVTWSGHVAVRPFMVQVFEDFQVSIGAEWGTVIQSVAGVIGAIFLVFVIHRVGKRRLALSGAAVSVLATMLLGIYSYFEMDEARRSGRQLQYTWVPLFLFAMMSFINSSLGMVPWALICEVFPFRTRGLCAGICSASYYIFAFLASKTFLDIHRDFQLHGAFWLYCGVNIFCFVFLYFMLPETEGKSLDEIERYFTLGLNPRKNIQR